MALAKAWKPIEPRWAPWKKAVSYPSSANRRAMPLTWFMEAGVRKNGSTNIGMLERMEGMPSMLLRPLQKEWAKVTLWAMRESTKGV